MTDMQNILAALIAAIKEKRITVDVAEAAVRMLDGVPDYSHLDAIKALLKAPSEPEKQPEDYLAVKTFTSSEFHIGDEVENGSVSGFVTQFDDNSITVVVADGSTRWTALGPWHRTGRNFPAIPAIMEELKKG